MGKKLKARLDRIESCLRELASMIEDGDHLHAQKVINDYLLLICDNCDHSTHNEDECDYCGCDSIKYN
jgi:hypothetical protein